MTNNEWEVRTLKRGDRIKVRLENGLVVAGEVRGDVEPGAKYALWWPDTWVGTTLSRLEDVVAIER